MKALSLAMQRAMWEFSEARMLPIERIFGEKRGNPIARTLDALENRGLFARFGDSTARFGLTGAGRAWIAEQIDAAHVEALEDNQDNNPASNIDGGWERAWRMCAMANMRSVPRSLVERDHVEALSLCTKCGKPVMVSGDDGYEMCPEHELEEADRALDEACADPRNQVERSRCGNCGEPIMRRTHRPNCAWFHAESGRGCASGATEAIPAVIEGELVERAADPIHNLLDVIEAKEHQTVRCESTAVGHVDAHFERPSCLDPHYTDMATRTRLNLEARMERGQQAERWTTWAESVHPGATEDVHMLYTIRVAMRRNLNHWYRIAFEGGAHDEAGEIRATLEAQKWGAISVPPHSVEADEECAYRVQAYLEALPEWARAVMRISSASLKNVEELAHYAVHAGLSA